MADTNIDLQVQDRAQEGKVIPYSLTIKNISPYNYSFWIRAYAPTTSQANMIIDEEPIIKSNLSKTYQGSFVMLNENANFYVLIQHWAFDKWIFDNDLLRIITLDVIPSEPEFMNLSVAISRVV